MNYKSAWIPSHGTEERSGRMRVHGCRPSPNGLPTAFIMDRNGKIAWIGDPLDMDRPLESGRVRPLGLTGSDRQVQRSPGPCPWSPWAIPGSPPAQYGKQLVKTVLKEDRDALDDLAWSLVGDDTKKPVAPQYAELALLAAQRADAFAHEKEPDVADTLAAAYYASGDLARALQTHGARNALGSGSAPGQTGRDPSPPGEVS